MIVEKEVLRNIIGVFWGYLCKNAIAGRLYSSCLVLLRLDIDAHHLAIFHHSTDVHNTPPSAPYHGLEANLGLFGSLTVPEYIEQIHHLLPSQTS